MRPQDTNGPSGATTDRLSGRAGVGRPGIACAGMYPARRAGFANAGPLFIVVNAGSGRDAAGAKIALIERGLGDASRRFEILVAKKGRDVPPTAERALQRALADRGTLVVAGGDGTINAVAQLAVRHQLPFGIIPEGTFNYLSRTHGIPQDPDAAIATLLNGVVHPVQVGLINDRFFFVNASVGLYPQLLEDREAYKRRYGRSRLVAVWSALVTLMHQTRQLEVDLDADGVGRLLRTPTLFVGNNRLQMDQVGIDEGRALESGRLVAVTAQPLGIGSSLRLMLRGALGRLGTAPEVSSFSFRTLTVQIGRRRRRRRVKVATDGEIQFLQTPLIFRPSPLPLQLIVPARTVDSEEGAA